MPAERLQKLLSEAGLCSRRAAEGWILAGRVTVNGRAAELGEKADPEQDRILVDGNPLQKASKTVYLMLNKPRGYVTTLSDEKGRKTAAELVSGCGVRVYPVGRLDMDSEGLLLFTNDGELTQHLLHPSSEVQKVYQVLLSGWQEESAVRLSALTELDGERIRPAQVRLLKLDGDRATAEIVIHEGKNRQVRRMCAACRLTVLRLRRVKEHSLSLGALKSGSWRYLSDQEIESLKKT